ncbi:EAL domain-containing protein [Moritella marina]|uniref:EAL domain-containing protein n=1 Tax=Moritella marina TaxID=90736 RepID=UPI003703DE49
MRTLSVKAKLIISLAIPTLFVCVIIAMYIAQHIKSARDADAAIVVVQQSMLINALVHEIQAERGLSASLFTSKDEGLKQRLDAQRQQTDQQFILFNQLIADNKAVKRLAQQHNVINLQHHITSIRHAIDADNRDQFNNYTQAVASNLNVISALQEAVSDSELLLNLEFYIPLIWFKEFASLERGSFHGIYNAKDFNQVALARLFGLRDKQELIFLQLQRLIPGALKDDLSKIAAYGRDSKLSQIMNQAKFESKKQDLLNEGRSYFGLINHYFKGYLLRRDQVYYQQFMAVYQDAFSMLSAYKQMDYANPQIAVLFDTLERYRLVIEGLDKVVIDKDEISGIDATFLVLEDSAIESMDLVRDDILHIRFTDWWEGSTQRIDIIEGIIDSTSNQYISTLEGLQRKKQQQLWLEITLILTILLVGVGLAYRTVNQVIQELCMFTDKMKSLNSSGCHKKLDIHTDSHLVTDVVDTFNDIVTSIDVTQHEHLLSSAFFNSAGEGMVVSDKHNNIEMINPAFTRMTGFSKQDVLSKSILYFLVDKYEQKIAHKTIMRTLIAKGCWESEVKITDKNNDTSSVFISVAVVKDKDANISHYIYLLKNLDKWKRYEDEIWVKANFDSLTNLPNREMGLEKLKQVVEHSKRYRIMAAVMFIDLDNFKLINDSLGHSAGDELLCHVSERLRQNVRATDIVCRLGGDEFVVILSEIKYVNEAKVLADKLIAEISKPYLLQEKHDGVISASIGITLTPDDASDVETLVKNADTAMYHAKELGRNNSQFYTPELNKKVTARMALEQALYRGLMRDEFISYYQPIFEIDSKKVIGVEALIRWNHPEKGLVYPGDFIDLAEEVGVVIDFGNLMITQTVLQLQAWQAAGIYIHAAINISSKQFAPGHAERLVELVACELQKYNIPGEYLHIEITERVFMENTELVADTLQKLRNLGVRIHLDDFGTGYSSLKYLINFPVDYLKIDRSFIARIGDNDNARKVIKSIVAMTKELELKVVAEGIEEQSECEFLAQLGCEYGQGFWFARPVAVDELSLPSIKSGHKANADKANAI